MNIQDAGKIKLDAKRLKEMKKSIPKIIQELHTLYNWVGEEIIDYEARQALREKTGRAVQNKRTRAHELVHKLFKLKRPLRSTDKLRKDTHISKRKDSKNGKVGRGRNTRHNRIFKGRS